MLITRSHKIRMVTKSGNPNKSDKSGISGVKDSQGQENVDEPNPIDASKPKVSWSNVVKQPPPCV